MNPQQPIPAGIVLIGMGLLIALISVPLLHRKVPQNRWYGVRVPASFVSAENWYALNEFGAKRLLGLSAALAVLGLVRLSLPPMPWWVDPAFLLSPLLLLPFVLKPILAYADTLPKSPKSPNP